MLHGSDTVRLGYFCSPNYFTNIQICLTFGRQKFLKPKDDQFLEALVMFLLQRLQLQKLFYVDYMQV